MKKLILSTLVLSTLIACDGGESKKMPKEKGFTIDVELSGVKDSTLVYLVNDKRENIDSSYVTNGKFNFSGKFDSEPKFLTISANLDFDFDKINKDTKTTDLSISKNILIGNEHLTIKATKENFDITQNAKGSKYNDHYNEKIKIIGKLNKEHSSLFWKYQLLSGGILEYNDSIKSALINRMDDIKSETLLKRILFIKENTDNYTGMIELGFLKNEFTKDKVLELYNQFPEEIQKSSFSEKVRTFINVDLTEIGDVFTDFTAQDQDGNQIKFSDLRTKKYTLIDFSTLNCGACVQSIPELKEIAETYKDQLQLITFSADRNEKDWRKSVQRDSLSWKSLWDGKGPKSETIIKNNVTAYPTFILLNEEGKIVDQWSGYSTNSLKNKMKQHLKK